MVRHAACLITRCRIRPNGRTSFQTMKGRRSNAKMAEFGEIVHFKIPKTNSMPGKFEDVCGDGVWLGCDMRSGEHLVGMKNGVFRASTIRRKPMDSRWSRDRVKEMRGSPSKRSQDKITTNQRHFRESTVWKPDQMNHSLLNLSLSRQRYGTGTSESTTWRSTVPLQGVQLASMS